MALACIGGALAAPALARAAESAARSFVVLRGDDEIGWQKNRATLRNGVVVHEVEAQLKVKVFGITAYRYELAYVEEWRSGVLQSMESESYDDGDEHFVHAARKGDVIEIDGSGYQGTAPWTVGTTSYLAYEFLQRGTWISNQTGAPLAMKTEPRGVADIATQGGRADAEAWDISGGYEATLYFRDEEWVGVGFDAGGTAAVYVPDNVKPVFRPLWRASL